MTLSVVIVFTVLDGRQAYLQPQLSDRIIYQEKVIEHGFDLYTIVQLKESNHPITKTILTQTKSPISISKVKWSTSDR